LFTSFETGSPRDSQGPEESLSIDVSIIEDKCFGGGTRGATGSPLMGNVLTTCSAHYHGHTVVRVDVCRYLG
jgi:hypothetical protein